MTQIFDKYPKQWGLRGDPFLWAELQAHFKSNAVPKSVDEFRAQLEILIQQLTGCDLDSDEAVFVPRYDAGGMSSGHVSPEFWREIAIPLLCKRFEKTERSSVVSTHRLAHPQDTNSKCKTLIQVTLEDVQMSHNHADASTILIKNIETLGKRFRNEHLGGWDTKKLESDWFNALCFLLERNFMRGRTDELSNIFLSFAIDRLRYQLHPSDDLAEAFSTLQEHHVAGHLDSSSIADFKTKHGMKGTANAITHVHFDDEIAASNPIVKLLTTECEVTVNWPHQFRKNTRLSNEKDLMMVLDSLNLLCQPGCQNVYVYLLEQIKSGRTETAHKTLDGLTAVGDKLASMTIRDICMMQSGLILEGFNDVFPVDTWVRQTAKMLGCGATSSDSEIKAFFRQRTGLQGHRPLLPEHRPRWCQSIRSTNTRPSRREARRRTAMSSSP